MNDHFFSCNSNTLRKIKLFSHSDFTVKSLSLKHWSEEMQKERVVQHVFILRARRPGGAVDIGRKAGKLRRTGRGSEANRLCQATWGSTQGSSLHANLCRGHPDGGADSNHGGQGSWPTTTEQRAALCSGHICPPPSLEARRNWLCGCHPQIRKLFN